MKKISLVQVNFQQGPTNCQSYYLPYSVGCLWAYANSFEQVQQQYLLDQVVWKRHPVQSLAPSLAKNDIVAFSTYVWNRNYNYELARLIKQINPECFLIFGGPEPAVQNPNLFVHCPFMDAVIVLEGERTFKNLLCNLDSPTEVPGLVLNHGGTSVTTGAPERIENVELLPSPYLTGFFDKIIAEATEVKEWAATIETNRGCPYQCTFCDWGSLTYNKVKKFQLERVFAELEWAAHHRCAWIAITDANFGMFVERDNAVLDKFLELQQSCGYPHGYSASYAKNQKREVLDMITKMIKGSNRPHNGLKISLQTLTEPVLDIIKRKNLKNDDCKEIFALAEQRNVPVGTEMILGLPGETLDSWKRNIWNLYDMGLHSGIEIFYCQMLENAEMNLVQRQIYDIKTTKVSDYISVSTVEDGGIVETVEVVVSTESLPYDDMVAASVFNWYMNTCHFYGFTNFLSRFVKKNLGLDYPVFYDALFDFLMLDPWFSQEVSEFKCLLDKWYKSGRIDDYTVSGVKVFGWSLVLKTVLKMHANEELQDHMFELLSQFMTRYQLEDDLLTDLMCLQINAPIRYSMLSKYPRKYQLKSNIYNYITDDSVELTMLATRFTLDFPENKQMPLQEFLERIYFTRLRNFGKAWITCEPEPVSLMLA